VGIDFHCNLARQDGDIITYFAPYNVQVKSASVKCIKYGGESKKKKKGKPREWKKQQTIRCQFIIIHEKMLRHRDNSHIVSDPAKPPILLLTSLHPSCPQDGCLGCYFVSGTAWSGLTEFTVSGRSRVRPLIASRVCTATSWSTKVCSNSRGIMLALTR